MIMILYTVRLHGYVTVYYSRSLLSLQMRYFVQSSCLLFPFIFIIVLHRKSFINDYQVMSSNNLCRIERDERVLNGLYFTKVKCLQYTFILKS